MNEENESTMEGADIGGLNFPIQNLRPCNLTLPMAQQQFVGVMTSLSYKDQKLLLKWVKCNWMAAIEDECMNGAALEAIAYEIRKNLSPSAILPSENIRSLSNENGHESVHVDSFLYDDDLVDKLGDEGTLDRNYCLRCHSHKTQPLTFISHSLSRQQLCYIFTALLPPLTKDQVLLDVGSRLGAVLYAAAIYTKAKKIFGVEMNPDLCALQRAMIKKFRFEHKVNVIEGDILHHSDVLQTANVIIMNNVFECFISPEQQVNMWKYLRHTIKPGTLVVTNPPIEEVFSIQQTGIVLTEWLREVPMFNQDAPGVKDYSQMSDLKLYQVL